MAELTPASISAEIVAGLRTLGYSQALLQENYTFPDWFTPSNEERKVAAAAFGQTPISYDSALIGVAVANGLQGPLLVNSVRALGAPILLEISGTQIQEWAVSRSEKEHSVVGTYDAKQVPQMFIQRAQDWKPETFLRAKNIGSFRWQQQLGLFAGLLPELEVQIQNKLDPLLRDALANVQQAYLESSGLEPRPESLFKLVFWILSAKVFYDRRVPGFASLPADPDELLNAVASHYKRPLPRLLNHQARTVAVEKIWTNLDFRNLSVDVLSHIWSTTLVDRETRKRLGIHRTSRTIVRYILEHIPFPMPGDDQRIVFEPCCGSAAFLIGAMNHLRQYLFGTTPEQRHAYFVQHLAGVEQDPFGVEISRLALTLADFPNPDGWDIEQRDVFADGALTDYLKRAGVVLCNPPFEGFDDDQRKRQSLHSTKKPIELLRRILTDLHPSGVLGFVLPRLFLDGQVYGSMRRQLAERFASIDLTILPDQAFDADAESVLLIASEPIPHDICKVSIGKVSDDVGAWQKFEQHHEIGARYATTLSPVQVASAFPSPELPAVWNFLASHGRLGESVDIISRGIRWNRPIKQNGGETGNRTVFVQDRYAPGYLPGVAPQTKFSMFEVPKMYFLSIRPEHRATNAWKLPWNRPKVIFNKSAKTRGHWRVAAFADRQGVTCYQTYIAIWPKSKEYDEMILAAILNSPVANAFISTREGKTDVTIETVSQIPMPVFTEAQRAKLRGLVERYNSVIMKPPLSSRSMDNPERLLKEIDAAVLDGYRMPPRLERELLDFFNNHKRPTPHLFGDYIPPDCKVFFPLSEFLSPEFTHNTAGAILRRMGAR